MGIGELKTCPFCGGEAELWARYGKHGYIVFAKCSVCDAQSRCKSAHGDTEDSDFWDQVSVSEVKRLWNFRNNPDDKPSED